MSKACGRTIGPRTRICRCDDASGRCSVSNRPDLPNASCPFTPPSTIRSTFSAILFPQHAPRPQRRSVAELAGSDSGLNSSRALLTFVCPKPSSRDKSLDGACDGWGYCRKRPHRAVLRKTRETGHVRADMFRTEPDDVEDDQRLHGRRLSAGARVDMRSTLRSSAKPSLDQLSDGEGGCRLRQKGEPGQRRSIPYHAARCRR